MLPWWADINLMSASCLPVENTPSPWRRCLASERLFRCLRCQAGDGDAEAKEKGRLRERDESRVERWAPTGRGTRVGERWVVSVVAAPDADGVVAGRDTAVPKQLRKNVRRKRGSEAGM